MAHGPVSCIGFGLAWAGIYTHTPSPPACLQLLVSLSDVPFFSSYGPTPDGRIKPDLVAPGVDITSAFPAAVASAGLAATAGSSSGSGSGGRSGEQMEGDAGGSGGGCSSASRPLSGTSMSTPQVIAQDFR